MFNAAKTATLGSSTGVLKSFLVIGYSPEDVNLFQTNHHIICHNLTQTASPAAAPPQSSGTSPAGKQ